MSNEATVKRRVQEAIDRLDPKDLEFVLDFMEFLIQKKPVIKPVSIKKPKEETPTQCIQRLKKTYPMLSSREMLGPTTQIMAEHMMEGVDKQKAIEKLEILFKKKYESLKKQKKD